MVTEPARQARQMKRKPYKRALQISDRHLAVVDAYFKNGFSQRKALRELGYAEKVATTGPHTVFQHPAVIAEIERRRERWAKKYELTEDWVIQRLMSIANIDVGHILAKLRANDWDLTVLTPEESYTLNELSEETERKSVGVDEDGKPVFAQVTKGKLKGSDKLGALSALARIQGMFKDKVEVSSAEDMVKRLQAGRQRVAQGK